MTPTPRSGAGPTVSVVIPVYNGAPWIGETLASLGAQTLTDWEAIVVDDCSPDDAAAIVAAWPDPRVRLVRMAANGGPVRARNRGVAEARGRYIAGLDQDDLCRPERLARQLAYLDARPEVALLGTQAEQLLHGRVAPLAYSPHTTPMLVGWLSWIENPLVWSSVMVRGDVARRMDPFTRPEILYAEDFDLYHRIAAHGAIARLDEPLLLYRQHDGGASKRFTETMEASATRVLNEAHHALLGDQAGPVARLLVAHTMGKRPVPDPATLVRLGDAIGTLQAAFVAARAPGREDRKLIRWETAKRWGEIGRIALRSGTVTLADIVQARPPHLGLGYAGLDTLIPAATIGGVRRAAQTFAEKIIRPGPSSANT